MADSVFLHPRVKAFEDCSFKTIFTACKCLKRFSMHICLSVFYITSPPSDYQYKTLYCNCNLDEAYHFRCNLSQVLDPGLSSHFPLARYLLFTYHSPACHPLFPCPRMLPFHLLVAFPMPTSDSALAEVCYANLPHHDGIQHGRSTDILVLAFLTPLVAQSCFMTYLQYF